MDLIRAAVAGKRWASRAKKALATKETWIDLPMVAATCPPALRSEGDVWEAKRFRGNPLLRGSPTSLHLFMATLEAHFHASRIFFISCELFLHTVTKKVDQTPLGEVFEAEDKLTGLPCAIKVKTKHHM